MNIVLFTVLIGCITYLIIQLIIFVINKLSRDNKRLKSALYFILILFICYKVFIGEYPQTDIKTTIDGDMYDFQYNNSVTVNKINKWYNLKEDGFLFIDRIDIIDDIQIRVYYRTNFMNSGLMYENSIFLVDDCGKLYRAKNGDQNSRLFLSGGFRGFYLDINSESIYICKILIGNHEIILNN